jgi:hypothetical protein
MCVGVSVWLGWSGNRVAEGCSLQHGYHSNPSTPKLQHTSNQEHTTNVAIQQHSRKLLIMDILMSETCWAHKKWNKIASDIKLVFYSSTIRMIHGPINIRYAHMFVVWVPRILLPSVACLALPCFPYYLIKCMIFAENKFIEHKICALIFSTKFIWNISHYKKINL